MHSDVLHLLRPFPVKVASAICAVALPLFVMLPAPANGQEWKQPSLPPASLEEKKTEPAAGKESGTAAAAATDTKPQLRLRLGFDYPLRTGEKTTVGAGTQGAPSVSPTLQAELRINPATYWFAGITFYRYLYEDRQQPWNPDFTYTFGYDDWHPNTFSLTYGNYSGNRLDPGPRETHSRFRQGTWSFGYKFRLPETLDRIFKADEKHQIGCNINGNITPRYSDLSTSSMKKYKRSVSLGCRYTLPSNLYANVTAFYYPERSQQQPWDPDFTYGFGYFDWRPGTITVQYNNYSGNRYPWRDSDSGQGGFRRGSISISWSRSW